MVVMVVVWWWGGGDGVVVVVVVVVWWWCYWWWWWWVWCVVVVVWWCGGVDGCGAGGGGGGCVSPSCHVRGRGRENQYLPACRSRRPLRRWRRGKVSDPPGLETPPLHVTPSVDMLLAFLSESEEHVTQTHMAWVCVCLCV